MRMTLRANLLLLFLAASILLSGSAFAGVLVNQPSVWTTSGDSNGTSWTSQYGTSDGVGYAAFDNFTLSQSSQLTTFTWRGMYWDYLTPSNNPAAANTAGWNIYLYSDNGGVPNVGAGPVFADYGATVSSTLLGTAAFGTDTVSFYQLSYTFSSPFVANAGTEYWITPLSVASNFDPLFSWSQGTGGDNNSYQVGIGFSYATAHSNDLAFTLSGNAVPEPSSLMLLGAGLFAVGGTLRRKLR